LNQEQKHPSSHLFTLRFWPEALGDDQNEWRGQVRYVTSGETRYFRDWEVLVAFLQASLPELGGDDSPAI
jgi:hypothetical protein